MPARSQRHYLAAELRRLRELAGLSGRELAGRLSVSQTTLVRTEAAERVPSLPEVAAWAAATDAPDETRKRLTQLVEAAYNEIESWGDALGGARHLGGHAAKMDAARKMQQFQPTVVPGLLQTGEYARRIFVLCDLPGHDVAAATSARLERQTILYDSDRDIEFLITEAALRFPVGPPSVLLAQLDRIASVMTLENVRIGLIPTAHSPAAIGWHEFTIFDGVPDIEPFVYTELMHAQLTISDPSDVRTYRSWYARLSKGAIAGDAAVEFIQSIVRDVRRTTDRRR